MFFVNILDIIGCMWFSSFCWGNIGCLFFIGGGDGGWYLGRVIFGVFFGFRLLEILVRVFCGNK